MSMLRRIWRTVPLSEIATLIEVILIGTLIILAGLVAWARIIGG
jgi:hypothetical protein